MIELVKDWFASAFATPRDVVAQVLGILPLSLSLFIYTQKTRSRILIFKSISTFLWAVHYVVLGQTTGALTNAVLTVRGIIFAQRGKKGFSGLHIPIIFILFTILSAIPDFQGAKNILPMVGSCLTLTGFWQNDLKKLRLYNFVGTALWLAYGLLSFSIPSIISNLFALISIIYALLQEHLAKNKKAQKN